MQFGNRCAWRRGESSRVGGCQCCWECEGTATSSITLPCRHAAILDAPERACSESEWDVVEADPGPSDPLLGRQWAPAGGADRRAHQGLRRPDGRAAGGEACSSRGAVSPGRISVAGYTQARNWGRRRPSDQDVLAACERNCSIRSPISSRLSSPPAAITWLKNSPYSSSFSRSASSV